MTIYPDQSKNYLSAQQAITDDNGFTYEGEFEGDRNPVNGRTAQHMVFKNNKNGRLYAFHSMDHFNTTIYSIKMKCVEGRNLYNKHTF